MPSSVCARKYLVAGLFAFFRNSDLSSWSASSRSEAVPGAASAAISHVSTAMLDAPPRAEHGDVTTSAGDRRASEGGEELNILMAEGDDPFATLGVKSNASTADVKAAYRSLGNNRSGQ